MPMWSSWVSRSSSSSPSRRRSKRRRQRLTVGEALTLTIRLTPLAALLALLIIVATPASASATGVASITTPRLPAVPATFHAIIHVPGDAPTIQAAVDRAQPGDLVLVAPGVYHEAVEIKTNGITLRGMDRNTTILDGMSKLGDGVSVEADNVVVENLTAHHYVGNGFYWDDVTGYRGSYLTAYDNGDYGIYAYNATMGQFDHSYASGSPDSGFYIGQCFPCDAIITDVHSENNALGYSGTNAGGDLVIENSEWDRNGAGIAPNTLDSEEMPPQHGATVIHNYVHDNGNADAPAFALEYPLRGVGIGTPGGDLNFIAYNRVVNNSEYGILVSGIIDTNMWLASGNVVEWNHVTGSGIADLALATPSGANNCFANNDAVTTLPPLLEQTHACGTPLPLNGGGDLSSTLRLLGRFLNGSGPNYRSVDYRTLPAPPAQANMPNAPNASPAGIFTSGFVVDHSHGGLPAAVAALTPGGHAMLAPLGFTSYSIVQVLLALYGNLSLYALLAAWLGVALWELSQQKEVASGRRLAWGVAVVGLPILGPILYYFLGGPKLSLRFRLALVVGAPLLLLAITGLLMVIASFT